MGTATRHRILRISFATSIRAGLPGLAAAILFVLICASFARAADDVADSSTQFAVIPLWWKDGQAALDLLQHNLNGDDSLTSADKASLQFGFVKGPEEVLTIGGTSRAVERAPAIFWSRPFVRDLSQGTLDLGIFPIVPQEVDFTADDALDRIERFKERAAQAARDILVDGLPPESAAIQGLRVRTTSSRLEVIATPEKLEEIRRGLQTLMGLTSNRGAAFRFLRFTSAEDIQRQLRERFTSDTLRIEINPRLNALYLQGNPATITQVEESVLPKLDVQRPQYSAHILLIRFPPNAPESSSKTILQKLRSDSPLDWALIQSWQRNGLIESPLGPRIVTLAGLPGSLDIRVAGDPLRHLFKVTFTPEPIEGSPKIRCTIEAILIEDREIVANQKRALVILPGPQYHCIGVFHPAEPATTGETRYEYLFIQVLRVE